MENKKEYEIGDTVTVTFGAHGSQKAVIVSPLRKDKYGRFYYKMKKFVVKSQRWTKPVQVSCESIIRG